MSISESKNGKPNRPGMTSRKKSREASLHVLHNARPSVLIASLKPIRLRAFAGKLSRRL